MNVSSAHPRNPVITGRQQVNSRLHITPSPRLRARPALAAVIPAAAAGTSQQPAAPAAGNPQQHEQLQAVKALVHQHGLDVDVTVVAQEALLTHLYLQQAGSLPSHVTQPSQLVEVALQLTDLLATGSTFRTLHMLKRHPGLLQTPLDEVAGRVLQLKMLMPAANIAELLYQKPTLLLLPDIPAALTPALNKLHALMPGIPVESKLHEGGTVFWSFCSLLETSSTAAAAAAGKAAGSAVNAAR